MSINLFKKNDPSINRDIEKNCQICKKQFSVFKREHQCKRCYRAICSDCGEHKIMVFKAGFTRRPHRGCKLCFEQIKEFADYINSNQLQFGKMSNIGSKWIKRIEKKPYMHSIDKQKYKLFTKEIFDKMWDSYNYSMRQFIGILTFDFQQDGIYKVVFDVFTIVISACPDEDFQSIAYLVIFMLCFCSSDKASLICLYLIELKTSVKDEIGLINAYFKVLGLNQEMNWLTKQYLKYRSKSFVSGFSINALDVKCSISIIDKIINRKKIDEIYIYLCLSIDSIKKFFVNSMDNLNYCDLMLIRNSTVQNLAFKYKQASNVRSNQFIQDRTQYFQQKNQSVIYQNNEKGNYQRSDSNLMTASFSEGIKSNNRQFNKQNIVEQKQSMPDFQKEITPFKKKQDQDEIQFNEDSFSMISLINQIKQTANSNNHNLSRENQGNQLLKLLADSELSPNNSIDSYNDKKTKNSLKTKEDPQKFDKQKVKIEVEQLKIRLQLQNINRENYNLKQQIKSLKLQNKQLREKLDNYRLKGDTNGRSNAEWQSQKKEYTSQISLLKANLTEALQKMRQQDFILSKYQQLKKINKKIQIELKTYQQQNQELQGNAKILKNKIQSLSLSSSKPFDKFNDKNYEKNSQESSRFNQSLKNTVREKNQQIQQLSKKNKLLGYQIDQLIREKQDDKQKRQLLQKLGRAQKQNVDIMAKIQQISNLLMAQQQQKLNLIQQIFLLKETMKSKGIKIS